MEEIKTLNALCDWQNTDEGRAYKLFERKNGSIIVQIKKGKDIYIQADLDFAIDKFADLDDMEEGEGDMCPLCEHTLEGK